MNNCYQKGSLILLLLLLVCYYSPLHAQETVPEWVLVKGEENGVKVYYKLDECEQNQFIILKVENVTSSNISFKWSAAIGNDEFQERSRENTFTAYPGEELIGNCIDERLTALTFPYNNHFENPLVTINITF